jgi:hypothetical protein
MHRQKPSVQVRPPDRQQLSPHFGGRLSFSLGSRSRWPPAQLTAMRCLRSSRRSSETGQAPYRVRRAIPIGDLQAALQALDLGPAGGIGASFSKARRNGTPRGIDRWLMDFRLGVIPFNLRGQWGSHAATRIARRTFGTKVNDVGFLARTRYLVGDRSLWTLRARAHHRGRHMQPLQDLLHRIKWDLEFGRGEFALGYYDRVVHQEKSLVRGICG